MRSSKEIVFRLRQEARNLALWARPPRLPRGIGLPRPLLPDGRAVADALRGTPFEAEVLRLAGEICAHRFPLLGIAIDAGPQIAWRRDAVSGRETGLDYFRRVPYLDAARAGDHKIIWELNRHQHLALLAQAFLFSGDERNLREIAAQLESWIEANPFHRGINWASALEVAFRALSWIWIDHLAGKQLPESFRQRWIGALYLHGLHLENNLSFYFSPNTHLLGEAVALHALGRLYPNFPRAGLWEQLGGRVVEEQMHRQVRDDGSHFEQSTYYHVYALDMLLFHALLSEPGPWYRDKLRRMAEYLNALLGPARELSAIGDDDGGRFFHPYGQHAQYGRATLATAGAFLDNPEWPADASDLAQQAAWWLGPAALHAVRQPAPAESSLFRDAGVAAMTSGVNHALVDAGPFGPWGSGHSHSDTLSLVIWRGSEEILVDAGTFTYVGDARWRDWFRGSGAHNTVRIDGLDQATPNGPFRWTGRPTVDILKWESVAGRDLLDAECAYAGFRHRRRVQFIKPDLFLIVDNIDGPAGAERTVEQLWHFGSLQARGALALPSGTLTEDIESWRSRAFGAKAPGFGLRVMRAGALPLRLAAGVVLNPAGALEIECSGKQTIFRYRVGGGAPVEFNLSQ